MRDDELEYIGDDPPFKQKWGAAHWGFAFDGRVAWVENPHFETDEDGLAWPTWDRILDEQGVWISHLDEIDYWVDVIRDYVGELLNA